MNINPQERIAIKIKYKDQYTGKDCDVQGSTVKINPTERVAV